MRATTIYEDAPLENEDHAHLRNAHVGALWCAVFNARQGDSVVGMCETTAFMGNHWTKARFEQHGAGWTVQGPPEIATTNANFAANSRSLETFTGNAPLAHADRQDPFSSRLAMQTEQVLSSLKRVTAAREFLANAALAARDAYESRLATSHLDGATRARGSVLTNSLLTKPRRNADIPDLAPAVQTRLKVIATTRDRLVRVKIHHPARSPSGRHHRCLILS